MSSVLQQTWNGKLNVLVPGVYHSCDPRWDGGSSNTSTRHVCIALRTLVMRLGGSFESDVRILKRKLRGNNKDVRYGEQNKAMRAYVRPAWFDNECAGGIHILDVKLGNEALVSGTDAITKDEGRGIGKRVNGVCNWASNVPKSV
jgi:hypothetical protein